MKKFISFLSALAFSLFASVAMASGGGAGGVLVVGGVAAGFAGSASGTAKSVTEGAAVAVGTVAGTGFSNQSSVANSGGSATIGAGVGIDHASVNTATTQYANIQTTGATNKAALNGDGLIQNGSIASAQSVNNAKGTAKFEVGAIGGIVAIGGIAAGGHF